MWEKADWQLVTRELWEGIEHLGGVFLVTRSQDGKPNLMTIGWFQAGIVWGRPVATVLVRPSRYSHRLLEEHPAFVVVLPDSNMKKEVDLCGSWSGREGNKFARAGLTPQSLEDISVPTVGEGRAALYAKVVQKTKVDPQAFSPFIVKEYYPRGDFHSIYFGVIEGSWKKGIKS
ncbi:MAG: hypothetical protein PWP04_1078 [Candidatus Atribacteria bacterium]|nr:hypothetical protein [Candidatus Atribacteria bacterium]